MTFMPAMSANSRMPFLWSARGSRGTVNPPFCFGKCRKERLGFHCHVEPLTAFFKREHIESAKKFGFVMVIIRQRTPGRFAVRKIPKDPLGQFRSAREDLEAPCENPVTGIFPFLEFRDALSFLDIFGPLGPDGHTQLP